MQKKKLVCIMLASLTAFTALLNMASCKEPASGATNVTFDELVPEKYGEWDGNYVYCGNVKSKTTGESEETLVQSVTLGDETYSVTACNDYAIYGNTIYMALSVQSRNDACLVAYDVSTQSSKTLFYTQRKATDVQGLLEVYELYSVDFVLSENYIVLSGWRSYEWEEDNSGKNIPDGHESKNVRVVIDGNGNIVKTDDGKYDDFMCVSKRYYENYVNTTDGTLLYAAAWEWERDPVLVCNLQAEDGYTKDAEFIDEGGSVGYLIETRRKKTGEEREDRLVKLEWFDIGMKDTKTLFEGDTYAEWILTPRKQYLYVYDLETYEYTTKEGETNTYTAHKNAVLYRIDYVPLEISMARYPDFGEAYKFEDKKNYDIEAIDITDGTMYAHVNWYSSASGCDGGGYHNEYMQTALSESGSWKTMKQDKYHAALHAARNADYAQDCVSFNGYTYYLRYQRLTNAPIVGTARSAYLFQRDDESGETDTMQLWSAKIVDENEKYCAKMWDENWNWSVKNSFVIFDK